MRWISVFALSLLLSSAAACGDGDSPERAGEQLPPECGDVRGTLDTQESAVVNGSAHWSPDVVALAPGQALAVGALMSSGWSGYSNVCTATLIASDVVLTAAHCVVSGWGGRVADASSVKFAIGEDVTHPVATFDVREVVVHPAYSRMAGTAANDTALLLLAQPADELVPELRPIPYNCADLPMDELVGDRVQTVGYGATDFEGQERNSRQWWALQRVVDLTDFDFIVDGSGKSGVCYGDSGGPCLWTHPEGDVRIVGTLSWGDELCAYQDHFARVDFVCDFIEQHLPPCGTATATGVCEGEAAVYCVDDAPVRDDCAALGQICGTTDDGDVRCIPDPCEGEDLTGRCDGDTAIFCEAATVHRIDCAATHEICAPNADEQLRCAPHPCGDETPAGRCDGANAIFCDDRTIITDDCAIAGEICGATDDGEQRCVPDPCDGETLEGRCDGNDAIWCEDGQVRVRECEGCGQTCGFVEDLGAFYCL